MGGLRGNRNSVASSWNRVQQQRGDHCHRHGRETRGSHISQKRRAEEIIRFQGQSDLAAPLSPVLLRGGQLRQHRRQRQPQLLRQDLRPGRELQVPDRIRKAVGTETFRVPVRGMRGSERQHPGGRQRHAQGDPEPERRGDGQRDHDPDERLPIPCRGSRGEMWYAGVH